MKLKVVSNGTHEGTYLVDAATGSPVTIDGASIHLDVCYRTARKTWQVPPVGSVAMRANGVLEFVEDRPGIMAAPESDAQIQIMATVPVEATDGTVPFRIHAKL